MRRAAALAVLLLLAGCVGGQMVRVGELEGTTITVHTVTQIEPGIAVGAVAFVQDGKLVGVVGGAVEGGVAGILSIIGRAGAVMGGLVHAPPSPQDMERRYVARRYGGRNAEVP